MPTPSLGRDLTEKQRARAGVCTWGDTTGCYFSCSDPKEPPKLIDCLQKRKNNQIKKKNKGEHPRKVKASAKTSCFVTVFQPGLLQAGEFLTLKAAALVAAGALGAGPTADSVRAGN